MARTTLFLFMLCLLPAAGYAADGATLRVDLDTVWLVTTAALVFFMQAGFALLEGGMARAKNAVNVIMKNYVDCCLGSLVFWLVGYGLMFGTNPSGWFGTDHFLLGNAQGMDYSLLLFHTMFAATAVTIASGAMAERTLYRGYLVGAVLVTALIYPLFGSWAWGGMYGGQGWLARLGFIDFAGSTVVHSIGGWVALAGIIVLGPRLGRFGPRGEVREIPGHNLPLIALGGFILWLGWFGFNGGSTTRADVSIGLITLNTHLAASAGAIGAMLVMRLAGQGVLMTLTVNGSIGGLVAITAGCATMQPLLAIVTGLVAGVVVVLGSRLLLLCRLDDVVGAVPVHGFCGAWGTLAAGLFHVEGFDLLRVGVQMAGIAAAFLWAFPAALLLYWLLQRSVGLRADTLTQQRGLDFSEHDEIGYPEFQQRLHQVRD